MAESARESAQKARNASRKLQALATEERVAMLNRIADALLENEAEIMAENAKVRPHALFHETVLVLVGCCY
jgi:gamma-glutamyl phosphate reductase